MKITIERAASHHETAAEMDRRGEIIIKLENKISALKKTIQYAYNDGFTQGMKKVTSGNGISWDKSVWKRDLDA